MMNDEELLAIKEKLYDSEKYPYINCRLIAKKLFEELAKLKAEAISSQAETLSDTDVLGSDLSGAIILQKNLTVNMTGTDVLNAYLNGVDAIAVI